MRAKITFLGKRGGNTHPRVQHRIYRIHVHFIHIDSVIITEFILSIKKLLRTQRRRQHFHLSLGFPRRVRQPIDRVFVLSSRRSRALLFSLNLTRQRLLAPSVSSLHASLVSYFLLVRFSRQPLPRERDSIERRRDIIRPRLQRCQSRRIFCDRFAHR